MKLTNNSIDTLREAVRNYHDSTCFVYLPSGACDCGVEPNAEAIAALENLETLLQAAEPVAAMLIEASHGANLTIKKDDVSALAAAVRDVKGDTT